MSLKLDSIGKKIQLPVLVLIAAILAALGMAIAIHSHSVQHDLLLARAESTAGFMAKISAPYIANFELAALDDFVHEVVKDSNVAYAVFHNAKGEPITKDSKESLDDTSLLHHEHKIVAEDSQDRVLGTVKLGYRQDTLYRNFRDTLVIIGGGTLVAIVILGLGIALIVKKFLTSPLKRLETVIDAVSEGALDRETDIDSEDEIGQIARATNLMVRNLRDLVGQIQRAADEISASSSHLSTTSVQISSSSEGQMDAATSTSAAIDQISASVDQVAEHAQGAVRISDESSRISEEGRSVVISAAEGMSKIAESIQLSAEVVSALGQRAGKIGHIVDEIRAISEQTNLLSLNAAIEAARAGEQGRGFAVVADEVRKLAARTATATTEITDMLKANVDETERVISSIEGGKSHAQEGLALANRAAETLARITAGARETLDSINDIARAASGQSRATREMAGNMARIVTMAEQNNAGVSSVAMTVNELQQSANNLGVAIKRFRV